MIYIVFSFHGSLERFLHFCLVFQKQTAYKLLRGFLFCTNSCAPTLGKLQDVINILRSPQKGGDPAARSRTATLLRLHPNYRSHLRLLAPYGWLTGFGYSQLSWCDGRCVQGPGTYSPQHSDLRLLAIPPSCRRVSACNLNWDCFQGFAQPRDFASLCYQPLQYVCSPGHKGHDDLTSSPPSSDLSPAVSLECPTK